LPPAARKGVQMLPIGPLMIEHRLIERVIRVMAARVEIMETAKSATPLEVEKIVHFIQAFADRCHHGKEEDILFRELARKEISPVHRRIMDELIGEHQLGRQLTLAISRANARYQQGEAEALAEIVDGFRRLVAFYPEHIRKEDKGFFIPIMDYFSREEKDAMLREGCEADSRLLHREHEALVAALEAGISARR
jgi:hemerythrin-like domain-containing protein